MTAHDDLIASLIAERYRPTPKPQPQVDTPAEQEARRQALDEAINGWQPADQEATRRRRADNHRRHLRAVREAAA